MPFAGGRHRALREQCYHAAKQLGTEVVVHQIHRAHDGKRPAVIVRRGVVLRVAVQRERDAGRQRAHGAGSDLQLACRVQGLQLALGDALTLFAAAVGTGASYTAARLWARHNCGNLKMVTGCLGLR